VYGGHAARKFLDRLPALAKQPVACPVAYPIASRPWRRHSNPFECPCGCIASIRSRICIGSASALIPTCAATGRDLTTGRPTSLMRGIRGQTRWDDQIGEASHRGPSVRFSTPPPEPAGTTMQRHDPEPEVDLRCRCWLHVRVVLQRKRDKSRDVVPVLVLVAFAFNAWFVPLLWAPWELAVFSAVPAVATLVAIWSRTVRHRRVGPLPMLTTWAWCFSLLQIFFIGALYVPSAVLLTVAWRRDRRNSQLRPRFFTSARHRVGRWMTSMAERI
jgi:hypothetical protein